MASTITGTPDKWLISRRKNINKFVTGPVWLDSFVKNWHQVMESSDLDEIINIYLGNISYVTLFEWTTVVALTHRLISEKKIPVKLNLFSSHDKNLLSYEKYLNIKRGGKTILPQDTDFRLYEESLRIDDIGGFIHAIGTYNSLNDCFAGSPNRMFFYDTISTDSKYLKSFYANEDKDTHTVVHGLTKVQKKQDCNIYLDESQIRDWRKAMGERFNFAHVFQSEELWRVMCHELSANIIEHAKMPGFLSSRVIIPEPATLQKTFRSTIGDDLWPYMKKGFVELCISDAGEGIANTLRNSFKELCKSFPEKDEDIVAFAFDEYGTCKSVHESFGTERHALGRILHVISRYGGSITVRTNKVDFIYRSTGENPTKRDGCCGYEPTEIKKRDHKIVGTHIQLLLPLYPIVDRNRRAKRKPLLLNTTPDSFRVSSNHVHSHLVPLLEQLDFSKTAATRKDKIDFRLSCAKLCESIRQKRPHQEPMVFDFSGLDGWSSAQFEAFLFYFQNIIINRPCLLVELPKNLAREVLSMEDSGAFSTLSESIPNAVQQSTIPPGETRYLETYGRIYSPILGFDTEHKPYLFGLLERQLEKPLLELIYDPRSLDEILKTHPSIKEANLRAILRENSQLFTADSNGIWSCVWDEQGLDVELNRVMSNYFDSIAERTEAWRGKSHKSNQSTGKKFNLSWQNEWRDDFLESSCFLSHERYVDEAAQRLIYRLRYGLEKNGHLLSDVKVLACVTGPAMLLATAMHRWWPLGETPPIVADLSYYALKDKEIPEIATDGGIVIVQDILDKHSVSGRLITLLKYSRYTLLCTIGLIHLQKKEEVSKSTITSFHKGWDKTPNPFHAMIDVPSPVKCPPPPISGRNAEHYWVEPRSLHPVPYSALRRDDKNDPELSRRNKVLQRLDSITGGSIMSGHFVVGERHYPAAIDVRKTLLSSLGDEIALWLADICAGNLGNQQQTGWGRQEGKSFTGDVTIVLMPLHSQIHYLWTKISNILAQRGRRQPMILLDASLFTGRAPSYWVPKQFDFQLKKSFQSAIESIVNDDNNRFNPLRILILDDAVTTAKTAKTILNSIQSRYQHILTQLQHEISHQGSYIPSDKIEIVKENLSQKKYHPIEWIRYFALLNQMDAADHLLWHNLHSTGSPPVTFLLEAFAPFMGVPVYRENDCPICRDRRRLTRLKDFAEQQYANQEKEWIETYLEETKPVAIDGNIHNNPSAFLNEGIQILPYKTKGEYSPKHADTGIWRFYELMYLSHPVDDILKGLVKAFPDSGAEEDIVNEYAKYRWAVLGWCLKNWDKVEVFTAGKEFLTAAKNEINQNTPLVEKIIDLCSCNQNDIYIEKLVIYCIKELAYLEHAQYNRNSADEQNAEHAYFSEEDRVERIERLKTGLFLFFMNLLQRTESSNNVVYLQSLEQCIEKLNNCAGTISHIYNLHSIITQPIERQSIGELLQNIAQTLFRGRNIDGYPERHNYLPRILDKVICEPTKENCMLLDWEIRKFLLQIERLSREVMLNDPTGNDSIEYYCERIIELLPKLRECNFDHHSDHYAEIRELCRFLHDCIELTRDGYYVDQFDKMFHPSLKKIKKLLDERANNIGIGFTGNNDRSESIRNNIKYTCQIDEESSNDRAIVPVEEIVRWISNYSISPVSKMCQIDTTESIKILINIYANDNKVCFEILTNYDNFGFKNHSIIKSVNWSRAKRTLEKYGLTIYDPQSNKDVDCANGFTCKLLAQAPKGYARRG